jgi:hypothetical protein
VLQEAFQVVLQLKGLPKHRITTQLLKLMGHRLHQRVQSLGGSIHHQLDAIKFKVDKKQPKKAVLKI